MTARALLEVLEAAGVRIVVAVGGNTLELSGKLPRPQLLAQVRASKAALLEILTPAKEERPRPSSSPDWEVIGQQPGHCASCARWEAAPDWGPFMGLCSAGRQAHGWWDGDSSAPVPIHGAHGCAAYDGKGYRARGTGKRYAPASLPSPDVGERVAP